MNDQKSQVADKLKNATNVLVTVSTDPSIDQIATCIALTMLLNKSGKNATAVFSGKVPPMLDFLNPQETLEDNTDSLRDFIITLGKHKADKLRYKIEDDVIRIFITPYKASITKDDLTYSAGDFNVDIIVALGVHHQQDLDKAIITHGQILHDAVTVTINNTPHGDLGATNWENLEASSLAEMVADLAQAMGPNLVDTEVATALLTGIVAETNRFSNDKTRPRTLTVSSTLLTAGADQQLVASQLQETAGVSNTGNGDDVKTDRDNDTVGNSGVSDGADDVLDLETLGIPAGNMDIDADADDTVTAGASTPDLDVTNRPDIAQVDAAKAANVSGPVNIADISDVSDILDTADPEVGDARQAVENALHTAASGSVSGFSPVSPKSNDQIRKQPAKQGGTNPDLSLGQNQTRNQNQGQSKSESESQGQPQPPAYQPAPGSVNGNESRSSNGPPPLPPALPLKTPSSPATSNR